MRQHMTDVRSMYAVEPRERAHIGHVHGKHRDLVLVLTLLTLRSTLIDTVPPCQRRTAY